MNGTTESSTGLPGPKDETSLPTQSEIHALLSSDRRRITLRVLVNNEAPLTLRELASMVADREEVGDTVDEGIDRAVRELHHNHLPRIYGAGLIHYDAESNQVDDIDVAMTEQILEGVAW